ncbi:MAG: autotransporter-associated beta strand repeat-containing protein, partial [Azoarcus sp.]|nr:autotransporter-associated beta strand repeat-containing protein [Azoarcus sp.]
MQTMTSALDFSENARAAFTNKPDFVYGPGFSRIFPSHSFLLGARVKPLALSLLLALSPAAALAMDTTLDGSQNGGAPFTGDVYGNSGTSTPPVDDADASNNTLTLGNGTTGPVFTGTSANIYGGYAPSSGNASNNTLTVNGGTTFSGNVTLYGGYSNGGDARYNNVFIDSGYTGTVSGDIVGGRTDTGIATSNTITIETTGSAYQNIYGGQNTGGSGNVTSGNILNLAAGNTVASVQNMARINFTSGGDAGVAALDTSGTQLVMHTDGNDVSFAGVIGGAGSIVKGGAGTLTLTGMNNYSGGTQISAGTLKAGAAGALVSGDYLLLESGNGKLDLNGFDLTMTRLGGQQNTEIILGGATLTVNQSASTQYQGSITGNGNLVIDGGSLILSGNNTYTGSTKVINGGLSGNIAANTDLTVASGATYQTGGAARTVNTLSGAGSIVNADGLTAQSGTFGGVISGAGDLTKTGAGTLTLSGTNTYTGATTVSAGILAGNIAANTDLTVA